MRFVGLVAALLLSAAPAYADEADWVGSWGAHWSGGDVRIELVQQGTEIVGSIPLHGGELRAHVEGRSLVGEWNEGGWSGRFVFTLMPGGRAFLGHFDNGEWWSGARRDTWAAMPPIDQSTPRAVMRSFLLAGEKVRTSVPDAIGQAAMLMEFRGWANSLTIYEQVRLAQQIFNLVDLTTVNLWEIPEAPSENKVAIELTQSGTGAVLPLKLHRLRGRRWWIETPDQEALAADTKTLLARSNGRVPPQEADPTLPTARDAMRRFIEAFPSWDSGGREHALGTLDLSQFPAATRDYEGALAAQYLMRVLERIGPVITQEVPDDPAARNPYVHFIHPAGRIAIGRVGDGADARWKFTADTVQSARDLFEAVSAMHIAPDGRIAHPDPLYFQLREIVERHAPVLLHRVPLMPLERWQLLSGAAIFLAASLASVIVILLLRLVLRRASTHRMLYAPGGLKWPIFLTITALVWTVTTPSFGLPSELVMVIGGVSAVILAIGVVWGGWQIIDLIGEATTPDSERPQIPLDEIVLHLLVGVIRATLVIGALAYVADALSIPYSGVIAGLGIGGLAVAFASKETLSNVFGAAILVIDRPFRRGDLITAGDTRGTVEHVGIRSTRIRTSEDSVLVIPNGKLADATINNLGTRRHRLAQASVVLPYGVPSRKITRFVEGIRERLAENPKIVDDRTQLGVTTLTENGAQIDLTCYLDVGSATEERVVKQTLMLDIINLADGMGIPIGTEAAPKPLPRAKKSIAAE
jgi:small-conductance mechanosensitive channel